MNNKNYDNVMHLGNPTNTIAVLNRYGFNFQKKFGQNFLIDENVVQKIVREAGVTEDDFVLEVGPGIGTMTQILCENAREVVAVEIDKKLIPILTEDTLSWYDNVTVINEDILKLDIKKLAEHKYGRVRILDIGTGSGCIAVSLAKNLEEAEVVSWDVSEKALQVAERNCRRNGVRVTLEQRDVLLASPAGERFDVIVSNPPYITEKEREDMSANVLEWEPELALFVPDDSPLLFYRKIAELGRDMLVSGGRLYFEINQEYGRETVDMLAGLEYKNIELRKDLFQNDRMIKAEK